MNKAKALKKGDTIGLIAPSSPTSIENVEKAKKTIIDMGFNVKMGNSPYENYGYLSGIDRIRANDIEEMFKDHGVDGIICLRGGYGTTRILDDIDYNIIRENPKVFVGYSDITALHIAFNQIADLVTFHGPMVTSDMIGKFDSFSKESLLENITNVEVSGKIENPEGQEISGINEGIAEGSIIGGNLSLIAATIGTPYEVDLKDKILFIEEIGEEPYKIDRMLNQMRLAGKFEETNGIILGDFKNCECKKHSESLTLERLIVEHIKPSKKPILFNLKSGHCIPMVTLPFGVRVRVDSKKNEIEILESSLI